jgi:putative ABC transport system permease protein
MRGYLILAWRYITFYRGRTILMLLAMTLTLSLPVAMRQITENFERQATSRAQNTPLVIGMKGSRFGLALHALYFRGESPPTIAFSELQAVENTSLAQAIPLHIRFRSRGIPIVGTSSQYFELRKLRLHNGAPLQRLGDCVIGYDAAQRLSVQPGDRLLSEPEGLFDLSGPAPLNLRVTGILDRSGQADDDVIFCDIRTAWIIEGIGHGHVLESDSGANEHQHAGKEYYQSYQEVTDENIHTFHFHGRRSEYPLTAILAVPSSEKSATLLLGKYLDPEGQTQILRPIDVVTEMLETISRVRHLFMWGWTLLLISTLCLTALVTLLSLRLRQREVRTLNLLGCSRGTIFWMLFTELSIVIAASIIGALAVASVAAQFSDYLMLRLM